MMYARLPDHQRGFADGLARDMKKLTRLPGIDRRLAIQVLGICNDVNPIEVERLLAARAKQERRKRETGMASRRGRT